MAQKSYTARVPQALWAKLSRESRVTGLSVPRLAKRELLACLERDPDGSQDLDPPPRGAPGENVVLALNDTEQDLLGRWIAHHRYADDDVPKMINALLAADAGAAAPVNVEPPPDSRLRRINQRRGQSDRAAQDAIYLGIKRHLNRLNPDGSVHSGKILFVEAPTGVGKTRAFVSAALDRLEADPLRVGLIACPTVALIRQTAQEIQAIRTAGEWTPAWRCIYGMGEFVSAAAVNELAGDGHEQSDRIRKWLAAGGRSPNQGLDQPAYLADDLKEFVGREIDLDAGAYLSQGDEDDDPAMLAYRAQFKHDSVQLIIATHAMVARELMYRLSEAAKRYKEAGNTSLKDVRWAALDAHQARRQALDAAGEKAPELMLGDVIAERLAGAGSDPVRLPAIDFAIVDEAHLLETNLSNALSSGVSTWAVMHHARNLQGQVTTITKSDINSLSAAFEAMRACWEKGSPSAGSHDGRATDVTAPQNAAVREGLFNFKIALAHILKRKRRRGFVSVHLPPLQTAARVLDLVLPTEQGGHRAFIAASPIKHFPQIVCGRPSIDVELGFLWRAVAPNAVLVSATLSLQGSTQPFDHYRRILGVTSDKFCSLPPVAPAWLTSGVTLVTPASGERPDGTLRFAAPGVKELASTGNDIDRHARWCREVCDYVADAIMGAGGGSLMLCSSYRDAQGMADAMSGFRSIPTFTMQRGQRVEDLLSEFYGVSVKGLKPLLIAVGAAWTGVDIGGHRVQEFGHARIASSNDNILTDLFIPRLPFGLNTTITHLYRKSRLGMIAESYAAAFHLKQGIGRLVRVEGLPGNRRIHVVDGRLNSSKLASLNNPVKSVFSIYIRRGSM